MLFKVQKAVVLETPWGFLLSLSRLVSGTKNKKKEYSDFVASNVDLNRSNTDHRG